MDGMEYFYELFEALPQCGPGDNDSTRRTFNTIPELSWLDSYYLPMEEELSRLKGKYQGNEIALGIFVEMKNEINFYKKYSDYYGYEFFIMQSVNSHKHDLITG